LNHLVFAKQGGQPAKDWLAATYEQMGYQSESGAWRSYYLAGAQELRGGLAARDAVNPGSADVLRSVPTRTLLDAMAVRFDGSKVSKTPRTLNFVFTDIAENFTIEVNRSTELSGNPLAARDYLTALETPKLWFNVVEP